MTKYIFTAILAAFLAMVPFYSALAQSEDVTPEVAGDLQRQMQALQSQIDTLVQTPQDDSAAQSPQRVVNLQQKLFNLGRYLLDTDKQQAQLEELCRDHQNHCLFISEFWRVRALKSCVDFNRYVLEDMASLSQDLTPQQQAFYSSSIEQCTLSYYYDNWNDVRVTIAKTLAKAKTAKDSGAEEAAQ